MSTSFDIKPLGNAYSITHINHLGDASLAAVPSYDEATGSVTLSVRYQPDNIGDSIAPLSRAYYSVTIESPILSPVLF